MQFEIMNKNVKITAAQTLRGTVEIPGDKSISHRALILAALAEGLSHITNLSTAQDVVSTINCLKSLGVRIEQDGQNILVTGGGMKGLKPPTSVLDAGNSGTTMRLLTGILAGQPFSSMIDGDDNLRRRPMDRIIIPLAKMGAEIEGGPQRTAPLRITGAKLHAIEYRLPIASAQVKSAILLAGLFAEGENIVMEPVPTRNHTEIMLVDFGVPVKRQGDRITLNPQPFSGKKIDIPGDFSSAAFIIAAALLVPDSRIVLKNVGLNPTRSYLLTVLKKAGATINIENLEEYNGERRGDLCVQTSNLDAFELSGKDVPLLIDEIAILAVIATQARGKTLIRDAGELQFKESDRLRSISENLLRLGAKVELFDNGMEITGPTPLKGAVLPCFNDHRIAMAFSIAGLIAPSETVIQNADLVAISYPGFYFTLKKLCQQKESI